MQRIDIAHPHTILFPNIVATPDSHTEHDHSVILFGTSQYSGGTHVPYPRQRFSEENPMHTVNHGSLYGTVRVVDLSDIEGEITHDHVLKHDVRRRERVLLKTAHSYSERGTFVPVTKDAVSLLASLGIELFGIDAQIKDEHAHLAKRSHRSLRHQGTSILEGLNLRDVEPGEYFLTTVPEMTAAGNVMPVRVTLLAM